MRLLLYNIRYATGADWRFHLPFPFSGYIKKSENNFKRLVEFIKSHNPDIVGLLEVDHGSYRTGKISQVKHLAKELEHYYVYESKYNEDSIWLNLPLVNKQGNAFLTNRNIKSQKFHYFKKGIKRLMIELDLDDVIIFLVHLSLKYKHRHDQLEEIYHHIKRLDKPVMVAGDFNPLYGADELELFLSSTGLFNANKEGLLSHPSRKPKRELDFILHSPEIIIENLQMPQVQFSDHIPMICDFVVDRG